MDVNKIIQSLAKTADAKIVVFGDYALDKYLYIDSSTRLSSIISYIKSNKE